MTTTQAEAVRTLAKFLAPTLKAAPSTPREFANDPIAFGESTFYVPETRSPIRHQPHQALILRLMFDARFAHYFNVPTGFQTLVFSTVKKSGKTTLAAELARWSTECWGSFNEVYSIANDKEQARGRVYAKALQSIQLDPRWDSSTKSIDGYWRIIEREATHLPSGSYMRAVSNDYRGEAGSNPTATFWSELWGYSLESSRRLWDEMTPVPTRPRSIRYVETYAGFENESTLLIELYEKCTREDRGAVRVTREDLAACGYEWPFGEDRDPELPLFVNPLLRSFAYWDEGTTARRMPWQTPDYYQAQAMEMRPEVFDRLHKNLWVSSVGSFIASEWWLGCAVHPDDDIPPLTPQTPLVLAADAAVSSDCIALTAVSRNPKFPNDRRTIARINHVFYPPKGGTFNYDAPGGLKETVRDICKRFNVVELAYDPYQLHNVMTELRDAGIVWTRPFSQGNERMIGDYGLYTDIRDRNILDATGDPQLAAHLGNAAAHIAKDSDTKLRIVKKSESKKIDAAVTLSMANAECKRLLL